MDRAHRTMTANEESQWEKSLSMRGVTGCRACGHARTGHNITVSITLLYSQGGKYPCTYCPCEGFLEGQG